LPYVDTYLKRETETFGFQSETETVQERDQDFFR